MEVYITRPISDCLQHSRARQTQDDEIGPICCLIYKVSDVLEEHLAEKALEFKNQVIGYIQKAQESDAFDPQLSIFVFIFPQ